MSGTTRGDQRSNSYLAGVLVMVMLVGAAIAGVVVYQGRKAQQLTEERTVETPAPATSVIVVPAPDTPTPAPPVVIYDKQPAPAPAPSVVIYEKQPAPAPAPQAERQSLTVNTPPASAPSQPAPADKTTSTPPPEGE